MVKAGEFWMYKQESAHHSPNLNFTRKSLISGQQNSLPSCTNPCLFTENLAFPGSPVSALSDLRTAGAIGAHEVSPFLPPQVESSFVTPNPNIATGSSKKGFFIFDQSMNQTRMFYRSLGSSSQNLFDKTTKPPCACPLCGKNQVLEKISLSKPVTQEGLDEINIFREGSEMREDSEEINALLYSDNDDLDYDDDVDGEDDEVASTGHSPFVVKGSTGNYQQGGEISEDFAHLDGAAKRQKLVGGRYQKSSVMDKSCEYDNDAESSCASAKTQDNDMCYDEQLRKDKVREMLRILGSIIPGSRSKEPLVIIDEAIDHLKSMKLKAKDLGVCYCP